MTAEMLINLLRELPPEMKIVVRGYEEGYNDISQLKKIKLRHDAESKWYYGEYFKANSDGTTDAVELFGENKNEENK